MQSRLDEGRIPQQGEHAAEIARGVEEVRIARRRVTGVREPRLQERGGRADHEEGQAHGEREQEQHVQHRADLAAVHQGRVDAEGQDGQRQREHREVQQRLPPGAEPGRAGVGIGIAGQQRGLEEDHAGAPHRRRTPRSGRIIFPTIGCTTNSSVAPTNTVAA
jgi:hypothetical protein